MIVKKQCEKSLIKQRLRSLFFLLHHFDGFGYYYFAMAGHWQHPASGFRGGVGVAKRPCSPSHARRAPRHRAQRGQRVEQTQGARRCSWSSFWRGVLAHIVGRMLREAPANCYDSQAVHFDPFFNLGESCKKLQLFNNSSAS